MTASSPYGALLRLPIMKPPLILPYSHPTCRVPESLQQFQIHPRAIVLASRSIAVPNTIRTEHWRRRTKLNQYERREESMLKMMSI
jgi:hypothetical protein